MGNNVLKLAIAALCEGLLIQSLYGTELRRIRKMRRLRLSDVAGTSGLHVSYLSRIETNERPVPAHSLRASIHRALSLSKDEELLLEEAAKHRVNHMTLLQWTDAEHGAGEGALRRVDDRRAGMAVWYPLPE